MKLAYAVHRTVLAVDQFLSKIQVRLAERSGCLIAPMFHGLFSDPDEVRCNLLDPQQGITIQHLRHLIEYFLERGNTFISPAELLAGPDLNQNYVLLTFDDGYFNNTRALPILKEYDVPATFFIPTGHVREGRAFWSDVLFRTRRAQGRTIQEVRRETGFVRQMPADQAEAYTLRECSLERLSPVGELDRPLTVEEVREFARDPHVHIGNHTCNHAPLVAYSRDGIRKEIGESQALIEAVTGVPPISIAYPFGFQNELVATVAREAGLQIGFTTEPRKEPLSRALSSRGSMVLGRVCPEGNDRLTEQCEYFRSDLMLHDRYQTLKGKLKRFFTRPSTGPGHNHS